MNNIYNFNYEKALLINNNQEELKKEAILMKECFNKQNNEKHSIECYTSYSKAFFTEKVFYEQLIPLYLELK